MTNLVLPSHLGQMFAANGLLGLMSQLVPNNPQRNQLVKELEIRRNIEQQRQAQENQFAPIQQFTQNRPQPLPDGRMFISNPVNEQPENPEVTNFLRQTQQSVSSRNLRGRRKLIIS